MRITVQTTSTVVTGDTVKYLKRAIAGALADIVVEASQPIADEARRIVPVDTGALKASITTELKEADFSRAIAVTKPDTLYAGFVEFGTSRMRAQPYMRPAFDTKKEEAAGIIKSKLRMMITDALVDATNAVASARHRRMT